jgi:hypothetical protein
LYGLPDKHYYNEQINEEEMGGTPSAQWEMKARYKIIAEMYKKDNLGD